MIVPSINRHGVFGLRKNGKYIGCKPELSILRKPRVFWLMVKTMKTSLERQV